MHPVSYTHLDVYKRQDKYNIIDEHPTKCKDFNDLLKMKVRLKKYCLIK